MSDETRKIAEFASEYCSKELPDDIREQLTTLVIDNFSSGYIGSKKTWYAMAAQAMRSFGDTRGSRTFGLGERFDCSRASFLNGIAIGGFEADHSFESHPGAAVFSAIFALGEVLGTSGDTLLRAMAVGYEVNCRVGAAQTYLVEKARGFHSPAISGVFGSAAACSVLLDLPTDKILSASVLLDSSAAGLVEFVAEGSMTKRIHLGRSAQLGLESALLAKEGITGPSTIFEGQHGFLQAHSPEPKVAELVEGVGSHWFLRGMAVKPYPAHGVVQPFIPVLAQWQASGTDPSTIQRVLIQTTPQGTMERFLDRAPGTLVAAQCSIPFIAALILSKGLTGLIELDETLDDTEVLGLSQRVVVEEDSRFQGNIHTAGGELTLTANGVDSVERAAGGMKLSPAELHSMCVNKLARYAKGILSDDRIGEIEKMTSRLADLPDITELADLVFSTGD